MAVDQMKLNQWFDSQEPREDKKAQAEVIRFASKEFAQIILAHTPAGPDQTEAIRKVREAMWTATAAIETASK